MREADIQRSVVDYVRVVAPEVFIFAVPNAAVRRAGGRAGNAVPGLTAGVPDLALILPGARSAFFECKTDKGKLSQAQAAILDCFAKLKIPFAIVRGIDDARAALRAWGVVTKEASSCQISTGPQDGAAGLSTETISRTVSKTPVA